MVRRKRCKRCRELKDEVLDGLCQECDDRVWCTVCRSFIDNESAYYRHRHLFQNEDCEWLGTGGPDMNDDNLEEFRTSLFAVLTKTGIADALANTIHRGKMGFDAIHFSGTLFGYTSIWCWLYPDEGEFGNSYGDSFTENLTDDEEESMSYGVMWLIGLDNDKTPEANKLTLEWINQFLIHNPAMVKEMV